MKRSMLRWILALAIVAAAFLCFEVAFCDYADLQKRYEQGQVLMAEGKYAEAASVFSQLGGYEDASRLSAYCQAVDAGENGQYELAIVGLSSLAGFRDSTQLVTYYKARLRENAELYEDAQDLMLTVVFFRDARERLLSYPALIQAREYKKADKLAKEGNLEEARSQFLALGNYQDSAQRAVDLLGQIKARDYSAADKLESRGKLTDALAGFTSLGDYKDSAERAARIQDKINELEATAAEKARAAAYTEADNAEKEEDWITAYNGFASLGNYKDSRDRANALQDQRDYTLALQYANSGNYANAKELFSRLASVDYKDSKQKIYLLGVLDFANIQTKGNGIFAFYANNNWGIVNINDNVLIAPTWDSVDEFGANGLAKVEKGGKYGYIDQKGRIIIQCKWKAVSAFSGRFCTVAISQDSNYLFGIVDNQGNVITDAKWRELGSSSNSNWNPGRYSNNSIRISAPVFTNGMIKVMSTSEKYGFIDNNGNAIGSINWDYIGPFHEGYAVVRSRNQYGFIDTSGTEVIKPMYQEVSAFHEGLAAVKLAGQNWRYIDPQNTTVLGPNYVTASSFTNGIADVQLPDGEWQRINKAGEKIYYFNPEDYTNACRLMEEGQYENAYEIFLSLKGYADVDSLLVSNENLLAIANARLRKALFTAGSYVAFGHYEQDNNSNNGPEEIEWIVLDNSTYSDRILLISRYGLDKQPYNKINAKPVWETCSLRKWLNSKFLMAAFNEEEQSVICPKELDSSDIASTNSPNDSDHQDMVFLLSKEEMIKYIPSSASPVRECQPTSFVKNGAKGSAYNTWWLRTPDSKANGVMTITKNGAVTVDTTTSSEYLVRPVIWVDIDELLKLTQE